jgi:hypothetical protein
MTFDQPLLVSQGVDPDLLHVLLLKNLFMVEDTLEIYANWSDGDLIQPSNFDMEAFKIAS